jgi:hypothetical protein
MTEKIEKIKNPYNNSYWQDKNQLFLAVLADDIYNLSTRGASTLGRDRNYLAKTSIIQYLQETNQYLGCYNKLLRKIDRQISNKAKQRELEQCQKRLTYEYNEALKDLFNFVEQEINTNKKLDLYFHKQNDLGNYIPSKIHYKYLGTLLKEKFQEYRSNISNKTDLSSNYRIARINFSSDTTRTNFERKCRNLGKVQPIQKAITFIEKQKKLNEDGKYHHKIVLRNLDELVNDFLFNEDHELKEDIKKREKQEKNFVSILVEEATKMYHIYENKKYLYDQHAFKQVLRARFKKILEK